MYEDNVSNRSRQANEASPRVTGNGEHQFYFYNRKTVILSVCFWIMIFCIILASVLMGLASNRYLELLVFVPMFAWNYTLFWNKCMRKVEEGKNITLSDVGGFLFGMLLIGFIVALLVARDIFHIDEGIIIWTIAVMSVLIFGVSLMSALKERRGRKENRENIRKEFERMLRDGEKAAGITHGNGG